MSAIALCLLLPLAACSSGSHVPAGSVKDISFVVDGTTTYGTLDVPEHKTGAHLAAALLLAGSGPTDRDGNQPPSVTPDTLKLIAGVLDKMGIMSLRFDKYFSGKTGDGTADPATMTADGFTQQADAAYGFLARQPETDQQRMLVVGHSEGGLYAMLVAESVNPQPVGLGLIEPQDEKILDLLNTQIDEQLNGAVAQGRLDAATAQQQGQDVQNAIDEFRSGQMPDTTGMLAGVKAGLAPVILNPSSAAYARSEDSIDPADTAAQLPTGLRVLVTDGTADTNVPPSTIGPLVTALQNAGIAGPGLRTLDGLNHELHTSGMGANDRVLAPSAIAAIQSWANPYTSAP